MSSTAPRGWDGPDGPYAHMLIGSYVTVAEKQSRNLICIALADRSRRSPCVQSRVAHGHGTGRGLLGVVPDCASEVCRPKSRTYAPRGFALPCACTRVTRSGTSLSQTGPWRVVGTEKHQPPPILGPIIPKKCVSNRRKQQRTRHCGPWSPLVNRRGCWVFSPH